MKIFARRHRLFPIYLLLPALILLLAACGVTMTPPGPTPSPTPARAQILFVPITAESPATPTSPAMLTALDAVSGRQLWAQPLTGGPSSGPVVVGNVVIEVTGTYVSPYPHSIVVAFDTQTGSQLWRKELGENTQGAIAAAGNSLLLATNAVSAEPPAPPVSSRLAALNPRDGTELWHQPIADQDFYRPLTVSDGKAYVVSATFAAASTGYTLSAFDASSGTPAWHRSLGTGTVTGTAAGNGSFYVSMVPGHIPAAQRHSGDPGSGQSVTLAQKVSSADGTLTAYRAQDGAQRWQINGFIIAQAERDGYLLATLGAPQPDGKTPFTALAYDAATGAQRWQSTALGTGDLFESKPLAVASATAAYVFNMPASPAASYALNLHTGVQLWRAPLDATVIAGVADAQAVYVCAWRYTPSSAAGSVIALNGATGAQLWASALHCGSGLQFI